MAVNAIELKNVSMRFGKDSKDVVKNVSIKIPENSFVTVLGTSGSGKTTLIKLINRLYEATSGEIFFFGKNIRELNVENYRRQIGYVIQQSGLFPHMTVEQNVAVIPKMLKWDEKRTQSRVDELLKLVRLPPAVFKNRFPSQLSGGQQQRVGIARALAANPSVLLMDEPFGALDAITRQKLQAEILEIQKRFRKTILFVTHDVHEAFKLGERTVIMKGGEIQQYDTPYNILFHPANEFVRRIVSSENFVEKLRVLRASSIVHPSDGIEAPDAPSVNAGDTLLDVLDQFLTTNAAAVLVTDKQGGLLGRITWEQFRLIPGRPDSEIYRGATLRAVKGVRQG
ncbi:MAG TPA: ABC transporter ATP-binding protein [Ruminococcaceae bacterium]|jgi:osmoprotectant transport system ATP-binding protein|nr:ABC transporter ATP-binding protein [Oscillospiraceae bacterium]